MEHSHFYLTLKSVVTCQVCAEVFKDPRVLPCCSQTICLCCYESMGESNNNEQFSVKCPFCQETCCIQGNQLQMDKTANSTINTIKEYRNSTTLVDLKKCQDKVETLVESSDATHSCTAINCGSEASQRSPFNGELVCTLHHTIEQQKLQAVCQHLEKETNAIFNPDSPLSTNFATRYLQMQKCVNQTNKVITEITDDFQQLIKQIKMKREELLSKLEKQVNDYEKSMDTSTKLKQQLIQKMNELQSKEAMTNSQINMPLCRQIKEIHDQFKKDCKEVPIKQNINLALEETYDEIENELKMCLLDKAECEDNQLVRLDTNETVVTTENKVQFVTICSNTTGYYHNPDYVNGNIQGKVVNKQDNIKNCKPLPPVCILFSCKDDNNNVLYVSAVDDTNFKSHIFPGSLQEDESELTNDNQNDINETESENVELNKHDSFYESYSDERDSDDQYDSDMDLPENYMLHPFMPMPPMPLWFEKSAKRRKMLTQDIAQSTQTDNKKCNHKSKTKTKNLFEYSIICNSQTQMLYVQVSSDNIVSMNLAGDILEEINGIALNIITMQVANKPTYEFQTKYKDDASQRLFVLSNKSAQLYKNQTLEHYNLEDTWSTVTVIDKRHGKYKESKTFEQYAVDMTANYSWVFMFSAKENLIRIVSLDLEDAGYKECKVNLDDDAIGKEISVGRNGLLFMNDIDNNVYYIDATSDKSNAQKLIQVSDTSSKKNEMMSSTSGNWRKPAMRWMDHGQCCSRSPWMDTEHINMIKTKRQQCSLHWCKYLEFNQESNHLTYCKPTGSNCTIIATKVTFNNN